MNKIFKKYLLVILLISLLFNSSVSFALDDNEITGEAALLIDENYDAILYGKNINKKLFPASTTKVMTAILAIEYAEANDAYKDMVTIDEEIIENTYGSHIALDYDEEISYEDLIHALLIPSANDAALAIAKHTSGSIDEFVKLMNKKAVELGAKNTHFANPNGLHDDDHYSTAYDLYLISKYAMENETFRNIVKMPSYTIDATNKKDEERLIHSTNRFIYNRGILYEGEDKIETHYEGIKGVKTGYTEEAGNCLITYAQQGDKKLYSVILNADGYHVYSDTMKVLDYGFNDFQYITIVKENEFIDNIKIDRGSVPYVSTVTDINLTYPINIKEDSDPVRKDIVLDENIKAPIKKGESLGVVNYYIGNDLVATGNVISTLDVDSITESIFKSIKDKWYLAIILLYIFIRIIQMIISFLGKNKKKDVNSSTSQIK